MANKFEDKYKEWKIEGRERKHWMPIIWDQKVYLD